MEEAEEVRKRELCIAIFFIEILTSDFADALDFMLMHVEIFSVCRAIVHKRINQGEADVNDIARLEQILMDKPQPLVQFTSKFLEVFN